MNRIAAVWVAIIVSVTAALACAYDGGTEPTRAPSIRSTPTPIPTASVDEFEERVAAGNLWTYERQEHLRSGVVERSLTSVSGVYQGFRPVHAIRLTLKCNYEGDPLVGITGMGFITTDERIAVIFRVDDDVHEQLTEFVISSRLSPFTGLEEGFIYQSAFVGGDMSPFYHALLSAAYMTITIYDYTGSEMTVRWRHIGGLEHRINEIGCFQIVGR